MESGRATSLCIWLDFWRSLPWCRGEHGELQHIDIICISSRVWGQVAIGLTERSVAGHVGTDTTEEVVTCRHLVRLDIFNTH